MNRPNTDTEARWALFSAFAATSALNYLFGLAMGWILLPGDFGLLAFAQTVLLLGALVLQSGFPWSLALDLPLEERERSERLIRGSLLANTALGAALGAAIVLGYAAGPLRSGLESTAVTLLVAASLLPIGTVAAARAAAQGRSHFVVVARLHALEVAVKAVLGTALVLLGLGVTGALLGFLLGGIVAAAAGLRDVRTHLATALRGPLELPNVRRAMPTFAVLIALALVLNMDLLALKLMVDDRATVGLYQAGIMLANFAYFIVTAAIVPVLYVRVAEGVPNALRDALRIAAIVALPIEALLIAAPEPVLALVLPASYDGAAEVLPMLAVGNTLLMFATIIAADLMARGRIRLAMRIVCPVALAELPALAFAVPRWGAQGAATTFAVASAACCVGCALPYLERRTLRTGARWLARFGLAIVPPAALASALTRVGAPALWAATLGAVLYLAACHRLALIRIVSPKDVHLRRATRSGR